MASTSLKEEHVIPNHHQASGNRECPASLQKVGRVPAFVHGFASPRILSFFCLSVGNSLATFKSALLNAITNRFTLHSYPVTLNSHPSRSVQRSTQSTHPPRLIHMPDVESVSLCRFYISFFRSELLSFPSHSAAEYYCCSDLCCVQ